MRTPANSVAYIDHEAEKKEGEKKGDEDEVLAHSDWKTIASDVLRAIGKHPTLPPLNAHVEGRLVSMPSAVPNPRIQDAKPPTEATDSTRHQSPRRHEEDDEAEKVGDEQRVTAAEWRASRLKREAERKARVKAEEESNSRTPARSSQPTLSQIPSDNSASNQNHRVSPLGDLPTGWERRETITRDGPREYFVDHNSKTNTWDDPRRPSS